MQTIRLGDIAIDRIADYQGPFLPAAEFFPAFDPAILQEHAALLGPRLIEAGTGRLMFSFHSFLVRTGRHTILIDACIGNDKDRPSRPQFHRMRTSFVDDLARLGVTPEQIDYVMCTHLHWDHVGWNTKLDNGRWVPTFPNAKYVMAKREFDHWQDFHHSGADSPHALAFGDSILPVVKTGQAELVGDDYALGDGLWFEPFPGHTPGNVVIHARSGGDRGVFIGDVLHHPVQCLKPDWSTFACTDMDGSRVSRTRLLREHADSGTLVMPAHFPEPTAGHICRHGDAYRFDFRE